MAEPNFEEWKDVRARADSLANAIFVIAGGAISVSIAVLLGKEAPKVPIVTKQLASLSWYLLLYAMFAFLLIKGLLIVQAYQLLRKAPDGVTWHRETTWANWIFGITGVVAFIFGMSCLVRAAVAALG